MKKIITIINIPSLGIRGLLFFLLFSFFFANAQKELWGVNKGADDGDPNSTGYKGNITKYDIDGKNPVIMHEFTDFATGKTPKGKLFLASNGKLYGVAFAGGHLITPPVSWADNGLGVLYEYDLILNKYRVIKYFDVYAGNPILGTGVLEPIIGKIYGALGSRMYCYDLTTQVFSYLSGSTESLIYGELMKASNGFLYGATGYTSACPGSNQVLPNYGTIFKVNLTTNSITTVYHFKCDYTDGSNPIGNLIETQTGILYGLANNGYSSAGTENGTIFEYNVNTNTFTKKLNFDGSNLGTGPQAMANGGNGKLYGVCTYGGSVLLNPNLPPIIAYAGTLFEYDYTANTITKSHDFRIDPLIMDGYNPTTIMKASTGYYFGISSSGIFKFNPIDNSVIIPCYGCYPSPPNSPYAGVTETLIEICRKPSYHEITTNTYAPSVGDAFTYDIQNTNATTYVWQNGTTVLPTQTTAVLNIASVATTDSGTYTCTMTNECGTTTTAPIYLNVSLGVDAFSLENSITLYPNPTNWWLTINLPKNNEIEIQKCTIATIEGKRVYKSTENNTKIDVSGFAKGIYIITLKTNLGDWSGKFVKE